jgi:vacuolar iron transporter family protein
MARRDAELVVSKMAQYETFFVGLVVAEDLGMQLPEDNDVQLFLDAFVMFVSYASFGCIPVLLYSLGALGLMTEHELFLLSAGTALAVLCVLGVIKSTFSSSNWISFALETIVLGAFCSGVSYSVGYQLMQLIN